MSDLTAISKQRNFMFSNLRYLVSTVIVRQTKPHSIIPPKQLISWNLFFIPTSDLLHVVLSWWFPPPYPNWTIFHAFLCFCIWRRRKRSIFPFESYKYCAFEWHKPQPLLSAWWYFFIFQQLLECFVPRTSSYMQRIHHKLTRPEQSKL